MSQNTATSSAFVSGYTSKRGPAFSVGGLTRAELDALVSSPIGRKLGLPVKVQRYDASQASKPAAKVKRSSK